MKTALFDGIVADEVDTAVMAVFNCERYDIHQFKDSEVKKVAVFILFHFFKYDWHLIGRAYQMTYLYVPTVAEELSYRYKTDAGFKAKIDSVILKTRKDEAYMEAI